jgi:uncharacterized membrane protein YdfJ with MMPL/SSD domain
MTLIIVLSLVIIAAVLLVPFVTLNIDGKSFFTNENNLITFSKYVTLDQSARIFVLNSSVTDSTTDNFIITYDNGKKTANAKLNIKKLVAAMNKDPNGTIVKTNILHTMYLV